MLKKSLRSMIFAALPMCLLCSSAYSGTYTLAAAGIPEAASVGPANPNINYVTIKTSNYGPDTRTTRYIWQWAPTGGNWTLDPAPGRKISHTFQLSGGPLTAEYSGWAGAGAYANFRGTVAGEHLDDNYVALASAAVGPPFQVTTNYNALPQTHQTTQFVVAEYLTPELYGVIQADCAVVASGSSFVEGVEAPCSAEAYVGGSIITNSAALVP